MKYFNLILILSTLLVGCKEDLQEPYVPSVDTLENGMMVLCEGLFQQNNSTVSWVVLPAGTHDASFFQTKTSRGLGDTGNDLQRYGGKIYIVVNVSSTIEVMSAADFTPVKQIEMMSAGQPKQPRSMAFANGNVYISCYDGFVDVLDTTTLEITERISVGQNPEGLAVSNNKLYVANSGGLNFPNPDSTVSVVDLSTNTELQKITVGLNPGAVLVNSAGDVFVISRGNYGAVPSRLRKIDAQIDQISNNSYAFDITGMTAMSSTDMIVYDANGVYRFNFQSDQLEETFPINMSAVNTLYGVKYRASEDALYLMDAMGYTNQGVIRVYGTNGAFQSSHQVGLNPSKILFF